MNEQIETVHIIFKTHLDVGFTDMPHKVVERYFTDYIPNAIEIARTLRETGGEERFVWTMGSWLICEYLDKAPPKLAYLLEEAIRCGDITWHAYPFTPHHELMDGLLFTYELSLAKRLDARFAKQTRAAKLTDIPGDTRATLHHLTAAGVQFLHIGVNKASSLPDVPPICLWKDSSGGEVVLMYHAGYGNRMDATEGPDFYPANPTYAPGMKDAVYFAFTLDNHGPHSIEWVKEIYADLRLTFPNAEIKASTMDAYAEKLWAVRDTLPVVTAEIGNTWIHGGGADPKKLSQFRALSRLRAEWLASGSASLDDPGFEHFSRWLMVLAEHTWGLNESKTLDHDHWNPAQLAAVRHTRPYQLMEESWQEARQYVQKAVDALNDTPLAAQAKAALQALEPVYPSKDGYTPVVEPARAVTTQWFDVRFDTQSGAIVFLQDRRTGRQWADATHPLGLFRHQSFDEADWARFFAQYIICDQPWVKVDFGKPGVDKAGAVSAYRPAVLQHISIREDADSIRFLTEMTMSEIPPISYGCPRRVTAEIVFRNDSPTIEWDLQWFDKQANRLPEAIWYSFCPAQTNPKGWMMEKIDRLISPLEVVAKGGRHLHGINRGVFYRDGDETLAIESLDAGIVAPGEPKLLDLDDTLPDLDGGWHFNLWNNKWGCNFPTWYEDDARFRFCVKFE